MELEESLGDLEHFPSPEDVQVERQTLVLFVIHRLPVGEGDGPEVPLSRVQLGQLVEDEVDLVQGDLAVVEVH